MVEEIYEKFKNKRAEALKQPETKELTPEKEKEILKQAISEHVQKAKPVSDDQQKSVAATSQQIKGEPKEQQIKLLTDLALEKGISHAIEVAKRLDNPYLLDELHDALVDELYNKLVEQGELKTI